MIPLACKIKEVFSYMEKMATSYFLAKFFPHLSNNRYRRLLPNLDSAAGQSPEVVPWASMNEEMLCMNDYCGSANLEAMTMEMNGDHDA